MMETLIVALTTLLLLRMAGALGARRFDAWPTCGAYALGVMLIMTGTTHFLPEAFAGSPAPTHADFLPMVPPFVPFPGPMIYLTGVLELLGAAGLFLARTRRPAGLGLAALFVVMLPANIYVAVSDVPFNGAPATPLWARIPEQALYIGVALWAAGVLRFPRRDGRDLCSHADSTPNHRAA
ncbi:DoxX family membrane protein [Nocardia abscessus]|uniref:DoxX family membrane protein n=2 Tax=Nocardia abscessus TaxID=120957 RepID=A0ABS0C6I6_9NOCA|nr:DoxX family membrane protein [Nocardia abscessus]